MSATSTTTFWGSCLSCCSSCCSFFLFSVVHCFWLHKPQTHWGCLSQGFPGDEVVKNPSASAGDTRDTGSIPGSGRSPGVANSNPFQYSCLENPMNRGGWWAIVHVVTRSQTCLSDWAYLSQHEHSGSSWEWWQEKGEKTLPEHSETFWLSPYAMIPAPST